MGTASSAPLCREHLSGGPPMYLSRGARPPAFLPSSLHYVGRWPSRQAVPALVWVRLLLAPASAGLTGPSLARLVSWSSSRTRPCPPCPPPAEPALLSWGTCSLKKHSIELGPWFSPGSGLWTQTETYISVPLILQPSEPHWNHITSLFGPPTCRLQIMGLCVHN